MTVEYGSGRSVESVEKKEDNEDDDPKRRARVRATIIFCHHKGERQQKLHPQEVSAGAFLENTLNPNDTVQFPSWPGPGPLVVQFHRRFADFLK